MYLQSSVYLQDLEEEEEAEAEEEEEEEGEVNQIILLLDFSFTVKAAPHKCVI